MVTNRKDENDCNKKESGSRNGNGKSDNIAKL